MTLSAVRARELSEVFAGVPLTVVFAEGESLAAAREGRLREVPLEPPLHVSDDDVYLLLPADIGLELIDIFADGDRELLGEAIDEALVVVGSVERQGKGRVVIHLEEAVGARALLDAGLPYAAEVQVGDAADPVEQLNALDQAQVTLSSALVDDEGLEAMLRRSEHVGASWRVPPDAKHLEGVDPTYAWSRRLTDGRVGVEAALFAEYEELVVLLRPAVLAPRRPSLVAL